MAITLEAIRAAGGIVRSDGNIFFRDISMLQGLAGAAPAAVAPQGEYPQLPEGVMFIEQVGGDVIGRPTDYGFKHGRGIVHGAQLFTSEQMRAHVDADRAARAEQPAAVAPQGVTAWMHPETLDVISDAKKHEMSTQYGPETRSKADSHSIALVRAEQPAAVAGPALSLLERQAIEALCAVAVASFHAADDSSDNGNIIEVQRADFEALDAALDLLDELPDDQPGYTMAPGAKAKWALRRLLDAAPAAPVTLMTEDQASKWAWDQIREEVGTKGWTAGDSCNFFGFFLHGWNYRGQYELQRPAALARAALAAAPQAPAAPAEATEAAVKAHDWRDNASYGGETCAECGATKGSRRGNAPCTWPPAKTAKRWPFLESPGEFTARLETAIRSFGGLLPAVRNVLIEHPPTLVAAPAAPAVDADPLGLRDVGEAFMQAIERNSDALKAVGWLGPMDCPSEIVGDLLNLLEEANTTSALGEWVATLEVDSGGGLDYETVPPCSLPAGCYPLYRAAQAAAKGA